MKSKLVLEIVWWIATLILVVIFLMPVYNSMGTDYPFYSSNIAFIVIFVTLTRYIFLLRTTWLADLKWVKAALIFLPIPVLLYAIDALFDFQDFVDSRDFVEYLMHMDPDEAMESSRYAKYQYIFFGTGAIFTLFLLPVRMIISIWRKINRGTV